MGYANIADDLPSAGYNEREIREINRDLSFYLKLREEIKAMSGETLDIKTYEADMRHLIDNYIQANEVRKITPFDDLPLLDIIQNNGILEAINSLPNGLKGNKEAIAETIENNVRNKIIKEFLVDPAFFEKMSKSLDEIIQARKNIALKYEDYLKQIGNLAKKVNMGSDDQTPILLNTKGKRAIFNYLNQDLDMALKIHDAIMENKKADWRGNLQKENEIKGVLFAHLQDKKRVEPLFSIVKENYEY